MTKLKELKPAISNAIVAYGQSNPWRAELSHRKLNRNSLYQLIDEAKNVEELLQNLEDYFSSADYYTGPSDKSNLEERIVEAIITTLKDDETFQYGFNAFGYNQQNHPAKKEIPLGAEDFKVELNYSLSDFVHYALDKYGQEKGSMPEYRKKEIKEIKQILAEKNDDAIAETIQEYLKTTLSHSFNSRLKHYLESALNQKTGLRKVHTRRWEPQQASEPQKILIFLHGWHDSVNSVTQLAQEAVKQGYAVIAYDHRGHGKDAQRQEKGISTDLLRVDFRKFLEKIQQEHPHAEIALAGHSMGGAILTMEHQFINRNQAVKSVSLLAPAVLSSITNLISPTKLFCRNMHDDVKAAQTSSDRFGGKGPSLFSLLHLMWKAAKALKQIFSSAPEIQEKWKVYSGKKDASVNYVEFTSLPENRVKFFPRGDHALQFGHRSGTVNREIVKDMEACFNTGVREESDVNNLK